MVETALARRKLISIIIATYNCGQKIENTLRSIFAQNRELFEVIVFDGDSTDDTLRYIAPFQADLTLVSEKDSGIYDAFNKGIERAKGEYLYFIGAGDCLQPDVLEQLAGQLPRDVPGIVYGRVYFIKQNIYNGQEFTAARFIRDNLCQQGMFYQREVFEIIGVFDLHFKVFADWFFNLKCFLNDRIKTRYIDTVIADYEEGGVSAQLANDPLFVREFPRFVRRKFGFFRSLVCRAFLLEPHVFNFVFYSNYHLLPAHLLANYRLPQYLVGALKPFVRRFRALKNCSKSGE